MSSIREKVDALEALISENPYADTAIHQAIIDVAVAAQTCACGHRWEAHSGHTFPTPYPAHCSQGDACRVFTPPSLEALT